MRNAPARWLKPAVLALLLAALVALPAQAQTGLIADLQEDAVIIEIVPQSKSVIVGNTFEVQVLIRAGDRPVAGAQVYLNFNPKRLQCLEVIPGDTLTDLLPMPAGMSMIDNQQGQINLAAGKLLGDYPSGTFRFMTVRLSALAVTPGTSLTYANDIEARRVTKVAGGEYAYPLQLLEGQVTVLPEPTRVIRLPLILR